MKVLITGASSGIGKDMANYAIKKLEKGKFYIIPGLGVKLAKLGGKVIPTSIISKITYKIQHRKLER